MRIALLSVALTLGLPLAAHAVSSHDSPGFGAASLHGCSSSAASHLAAAARRVGHGVVSDATVIASSNGVDVTAAPTAAMVHATGDDLVGGLDAAVLSIGGGGALILRVSADPAAVAEVEDLTSRGEPTPPGNASCEFVDLDGTVVLSLPCDLQAVYPGASPDLPDDGGTLDAALLVDRGDPAAGEARRVKVTIWVQGWGVRVCAWHIFNTPF